MQLAAQLEYNLVAAATERELKLLVRLQGPAPETGRVRRPINLAVVVDRSGSMAGEKIENTRRALKTLVTHLGPDDLITIVQFDDDAQTLVEPTPVRNKDALKRLIDRIDSGGSTNLSGGWLMGLERLARHAGPAYTHRCLLMTDGQANQGVQDREALKAIGREARARHGIVTTTLGFGGDFNEDLLVALARESGGAFYFVEKSEQAPAIFQEELNGLLTLVAQNAEVAIRPCGLVRLMAQWTDHPGRVLPDGVAFSLGDIYAGDQKEVLVSLVIPALPDATEFLVARVEAAFTNVAGAVPVPAAIVQEVSIRTGSDGGVPVADAEVLRQYGIQIAARARRKAVQEADAGDYARAERTLRQTADRLAVFEDPAGLLAAEVEDLRSQAGQLDGREYEMRSRKILCETAFNASTGRQAKVVASRQRRAAASGTPRGPGAGHTV